MSAPSSPARVLLRRWQQDALDRFRASSRPDFLAVAVPGAGKTTFALVAARVHLAGRRGRLVVVVPTRHLRQQWADAAARFGLVLLSEWDGRGAMPADVHGVCTTYQQVASNPGAFRTASAGGMVVLDEIHHAGAERAWGDALTAAFAGAERRLSLSGTPFRSDDAEIPFVEYHLDTAWADYEYGYGEALADGVVRPVFFPRFDGHMEWTAPDGSRLEATFDAPLTRSLANQRLRTALAPGGDWLPAVLARADQRLTAMRRDDPRAGGLVLTIDQDHARSVARLLERLGTPPLVATSDDPEASDRIARFAAGSHPWLVAVRMVSEGVDIPRLRVAVWATVTTSELFFRQAVGRIARVTEHDDQRAWMFLPDDFRLRTHAARIAEARRHELRRRDGDEDEDERDVTFADPDAVIDGDTEQLSLFEALSSHLLDEHDDERAGPDAGPTDAGAAGAIRPGDGYDFWPDGAIAVGRGVPFDLADLAPPAVAAANAEADVGAGAGAATVSASKRRRELRALNSAVAGDLARVTAMTHAQVNRELNRLAGIASVGEATAAQLETRLQKGRDWLTQAGRRR